MLIYIKWTSNPHQLKTVLDISGVSGLTGTEAERRLGREGYNELPASRKRTLLPIALEAVREPMFLLLIAGGAIYLLLGDVREAAMLLGFVFVVLGITLYQESKTERALSALRDLSSPRALVIRDGMQVRIPGREVVRGDVMVLSEGDRVPADAVLFSCINLSVDESLLTGESVPVRKTACEGPFFVEMGAPGGEGQPFVYSGTLVVQGYGLARVEAVGQATQMGRIGRGLQSIGPEETRLQKETGRLVKRLAAAGLSLCAVIVIVYGLTRGNWLNGFLAGITLAMAILPEEFPVVLTVFLALGAWRMSRKKVLTRKVTAVETLGSATVLCVDKTGTLTLNRMTVQKLFADGKSFDAGTVEKKALPEEFHGLVEFGILASQKNPFDPMEKALIELGQDTLSRTEHLHYDWKLVQEYPLSRELLAMSRVWRSPDKKDYIIAAKGAPEAVADICHMDERQTKELSEYVDRMAKEGQRQRTCRQQRVFVRSSC